MSVVLGEQCDSSWIIFGLKRGIPCLFSVIIIIYWQIYIDLLFWITIFQIKTFKIPGKLDADETYASMGLNGNSQEPGETNVNVSANDASTDIKTIPNN